MTRKILLSFSLLSAGLCLAAPITPQEALQRLNNNGLAPITRSAEALDPVMVLNTHIGEPALYVFANQANSGFMILSADDAITPLLGYSDNAALDPENISPALKNWLNKYTEQIEYVRLNNPEMGFSAGVTIELPKWDPIGPMVKTKWNQTAPYNNLCPQYNGTNCYTGCVATAMAQIMKYWEYPKQGQGSISYKCSSLNKTLSLDFSTLTFDYNNMLNSYNGSYTAEEATAVATLMMAAGYSVQMSYTTNTSGAVSGLINGSLIDYFNYDKGARYEIRDQYDYSTWAKMIYDNLKNVGPVIYDGNSVSSGGHSFICDGYQGNGYFHFNWGWSGSGDGYFLLDALNPSSIGVGGGGGGFNYDQDCLLGLQPPTGQEVEEQHSLMMYGSVEGIFSSSTQLAINLVNGAITGWSYKGVGEMTIDLGASFVPVDKPDATPLYLTSTNPYTTGQTLDPMGYIPVEYSGYNLRPTFRLSKLELEKGVKYKVTNVYQPEGTEDWYPVTAAVGSYNYFYITKTGDGTTSADFEIENFYPMQYTCSKLTFDTDLYNGIAVEVSATLTNNNDTELTRGVCLVLYDEQGTLRYQGEAFVVSLSPGETFSQSWITALTAMTSTTVSKALPLYAGLYDPETDTEYYHSETPVTMQPNPGRPTYTTTLTIDNGEFKSNKYYVENSNDIQVTFNVDVTRNIFSYPVQLWVATLSGQTYWKELSYPLETMIVEANETGEVTTQISFPDAVVNSTYYIISLVNDNFDNSVAFVAESNQAGVEELLVNDEAPVILYVNALGKAYVKGGNSRIDSVEVYSLNGMRLAPQVNYNGDSAEVDLSSLGKGIVLVTATDSKGNRTSAKIAL